MMCWKLSIKLSRSHSVSVSYSPSPPLAFLWITNRIDVRKYWHKRLYYILYIVAKWKKQIKIEILCKRNANWCKSNSVFEMLDSVLDCVGKIPIHKMVKDERHKTQKNFKRLKNYSHTRKNHKQCKNIFDAITYWNNKNEQLKNGNELKPNKTGQIDKQSQNSKWKKKERKSIKHHWQQFTTMLWEKWKIRWGIY